MMTRLEYWLGLNIDILSRWEEHLQAGLMFDFVQRWQSVHLVKVGQGGAVRAADHRGRRGQI